MNAPMPIARQAPDMYELERKSRADHTRLRDRLAELDVGRASVRSQVDTYFDHPCRSFATTDEALRLREERSLENNEAVPSCQVTYKGPRVTSETKTRFEGETEVEDYEELRTILERLGFSVVGTVEKQRATYEATGIQICLDTVENLGEFVEIETHATEDAVAEGNARIDRWTERLGLGETEPIVTPYLELLIESEE